MSSSTIRMSGMVSGLDTESLVSAMVSTYVSKKEKYQKAQTKLTWKQDAYKAINTKVYSLYSKISNLRFSTAYSMKKTTVSDSTKATITAGSNAINGTQTLEIKELAKSGYLTGAKLAGGTSESTTLGQLGYTGDDTTITVRLASGAKDITVGKDTKISDLVSSLNSAGVKASYDATNNRIFVSASSTGTANDFALTASDMSGLQALNAAGLSVASEANNAAYASTAAYALGTMGTDASGNVVSYFQLDSDGNIMYDKDGKALVTDGVTYSAEETQKAIAATMEKLATAYTDNASMAAEKTELQNKTKYSNAKDAVDEFIANGGDDAKQLVQLLEIGSTEYKYVDDETGAIYTNKSDYRENGVFAGYTYTGTVTDADGTTHTVTKTVKNGEGGVSTIADKITELKEKEGLGLVTKTTSDDGTETTDSSAYDTLKSNVATMYAVDGNATYTDADKAAYYLTEDERTAAQERITEIGTLTAANNQIIADNSYWDVKDYSAYYDSATQTLDMDKLNELASSITDKITMGKEMVEGNITIPISEGATRVNGQDARIILNDAEFTSDSNTFSINGLTIKAMSTTKDNEPLTITTDTDTQGLYDKVKDFLSQYNTLINELCSLYNADSASGYEPLTDDEKSSMSDTDIEKWETKIKDSLLRRDSTISGVMNAMTTAMMKTYTVNGKTYSLANFGIKTLGYLNAAANENYAYHIDGDEEDDVSSGNTDKLMAALNSDPDSVVEFMKQLTSGLYTALDNKMKSSTLSSAYTIYNDKQMASEYSSYTKLISTWEDKIEDMEDRYYSKFSSMETALAKLQSSSSSISSLFSS
jgi:flagellar hook-associated protein 2